MFNPSKIRQEMKKAISILRIATLAIMGCVGALFLFGEEQDEEILPFVLHLLFDKLFAIFMIALMLYLAIRWSEKDEWLQAIDKWCDE